MTERAVYVKDANGVVITVENCTLADLDVSIQALGKVLASIAFPCTFNTGSCPASVAAAA